MKRGCIEFNIKNVKKAMRLQLHFSANEVKRKHKMSKFVQFIKQGKTCKVSMEELCEIKAQHHGILRIMQPPCMDLSFSSKTFYFERECKENEVVVFKDKLLGYL